MESRLICCHPDSVTQVWVTARSVFIIYYMIGSELRICTGPLKVRQLILNAGTNNANEFQPRTPLGLVCETYMWPDGNALVVLCDVSKCEHTFDAVSPMTLRSEMPVLLLSEVCKTLSCNSSSFEGEMNTNKGVDLVHHERDHAIWLYLCHQCPAQIDAPLGRNEGAPKKHHFGRSTVEAFVDLLHQSDMFALFNNKMIHTTERRSLDSPVHFSVCSIIGNKRLNIDQYDEVYSSILQFRAKGVRLSNLLLMDNDQGVFRLYNRGEIQHKSDHKNIMSIDTLNVSNYDTAHVKQQLPTTTKRRVESLLYFKASIQCTLQDSIRSAEDTVDVIRTHHQDVLESTQRTIQRFKGASRLAISLSNTESIRELPTCFWPVPDPHGSRLVQTRQHTLQVVAVLARQTYGRRFLLLAPDSAGGWLSVVSHKFTFKQVPFNYMPHLVFCAFVVKEHT